MRKSIQRVKNTPEQSDAQTAVLRQHFIRIFGSAGIAVISGLFGRNKTEVFYELQE